VLLMSSNARFECQAAVDENLKRNWLRKENERDCAGMSTKMNGFLGSPSKLSSVFSKIVVHENF